MALKPPPPPWEVLQQVGKLVGGGESGAENNLRALAQSMLTRLDMVSREEFDAQAALLARTQARVAELETELAELAGALEALQREPPQ